MFKVQADMVDLRVVKTNRPVAEGASERGPRVTGPVTYRDRI